MASENRDRIEFWLDDKQIMVVDSSFAPDRGDMVTIGDETYDVAGRSYTVDYPSKYWERRMVCILTLKLHEGAISRLPR